MNWLKIIFGVYTAVCSFWMMVTGNLFVGRSQPSFRKPTQRSRCYSAILVVCIGSFVALWTAARQASLSITVSPSLLKLVSVESVMPSNHLILPSPSPPALNLSQPQGLSQWVSFSHQVPKVWKLQLQHQSFQRIFTFRTDSYSALDAAEDTLPGTSLGLHWLGLWASTARGWVLIPGWGTKTAIYRTVQCRQKEKDMFPVGTVSKSSCENTSPVSIFKPRIIIVPAGNSTWGSGPQI